MFFGTSRLQTAPAVWACESDLYVLLRDEPGPVSQQLVEAVQAAQLGGRVLQAAQPALLAARLQEAGAVLLHQVLAVVPGRGLVGRQT